MQPAASVVKSVSDDTWNYVGEYLSPLGRMVLASDGHALTGAWFDDQAYFSGIPVHARPWDRLPIFIEAREWLERYFAGHDPGPTPPLRAQGSAFRQDVWTLLRAIPYGETTTYGELAREVARLQHRTVLSAQAVGGAVGHNPLSIFIPCHRVMGHDGSLTGYAGGIERKRQLLRLENPQFRG